MLWGKWRRLEQYVVRSHRLNQKMLVREGAALLYFLLKEILKESFELGLLEGGRCPFYLLMRLV